METTDSKELPSIRAKSLMNVQIEITVSVGKTRMALSELIKLESESILKLDRKIDDSVDLFIEDRLIARGELETSESNPEQLVVRLTEVADLSEGL